MAITRDTDWEDIVRAVQSLPKLAHDKGVDVAVAWAEFELRSLVSLIDLTDPRTPAAARNAHRALSVVLTDGFIRVMVRNDGAGFRMRRDVLAIWERVLLGPTLKSVFARSAPDTRTPYMPQVG